MSLSFSLFGKHAACCQAYNTCLKHTYQIILTVAQPTHKLLPKEKQCVQARCVMTPSAREMKVRASISLAWSICRQSLWAEASVSCQPAIGSKAGFSSCWSTEGKGRAYTIHVKSLMRSMRSGLPYPPHLVNKHSPCAGLLHKIPYLLSWEKCPQLEDVQLNPLVQVKGSDL